MSRFNNLKALARVEAPPYAAATLRASSLPGLALVPAPSLSSAPGLAPTITQRISFALVCIFLLSGYANDFTNLIFREKAYISTACLFLVPISFLVTGASFRGLRHPIGRFWMAFGIWLIVAAPLSVWRGGTFDLLINYFPRSFMLTYYVAASAISLRQCRQLLYTLIGGAFFVIFSCFAFGSFYGRRLSIPHSIFFSNANELALQLALGMAYMVFVFFLKSKLLKILCFGGIVLSLSYMLKTGSRGVFVAVALVAIVAFLSGRRQLLLVAGALPVLIITVALLPQASRERLGFLGTDSSFADVSDEVEASALASQYQRERLLWESIAFTFANPLFGVGPGEFMVAENGEKEKGGGRGEWRGTHNSYTEVSSEAGLPAFFFYTMALFLCLRQNYRRYRRTAGIRGLEEVAGLSFTLFVAAMVYALATFFFHITYSSYLPLTLGLTIAVELASGPALARQPAH